MASGRRSFLTKLPFLGAIPAVSATVPRSRSLRERLVSVFDSMWIADTHEHLWDEHLRVSRPIDFFDLLYQYTDYDLQSAGLPLESRRVMLSKEAADVDRWRAVENYWRVSRFTGFSQMLRLAIRDIYGIEDISVSTIRKINEAIRASNKPGLYRRILKDRAKIQFYVLDDRTVVPIKANREFFVVAREFDQFIIPATPTDVRKLEQLTNVSITSLSSLKHALEKNFQQALEASMVAVKSLLAYQREILFQEVDESAAAKNFDSLMRGDQTLPEGFHRFVNRPFRQLEDHMFHHVIKLADAHRLPVQIHTGLNNGHFIENSNPRHLTNLFFLYPRTQFDLFHIGYPYQQELSALAKSFANVYIDFCWAHEISHTVSHRTLDDCLETVPANKILGFGGDHWHPELSYACAKIARQTIGDVLALKTESGFCTEKEAIELGRLILHDNIARLYWHTEHG